MSDTTSRYERNPNCRGNGILDYLKDHQAEAYVILDDENFRDYQNRPAIQDHLVLIDYMTGLSDDDVEKAIKILSNN